MVSDSVQIFWLILCAVCMQSQTSAYAETHIYLICMEGCLFLTINWVLGNHVNLIQGYRDTYRCQLKHDLNPEEGAIVVHGYTTAAHHARGL
jgi:hypothetical protein